MRRSINKTPSPERIEKRAPLREDIFILKHQPKLLTRNELAYDVVVVQSNGSLMIAYVDRKHS